MMIADKIALSSLLEKSSQIAQLSASGADQTWGRRFQQNQGFPAAPRDGERLSNPPLEDDWAGLPRPAHQAERHDR